MPNLVNAERISVAFGTRTLLDGLSLGLGRGDVVGVVGRNGDGKTTLLQVLTGVRGLQRGGRVARTELVKGDEEQALAASRSGPVVGAEADREVLDRVDVHGPVPA